MFTLIAQAAADAPDLGWLLDLVAAHPWGAAFLAIAIPIAMVIIVLQRPLGRLVQSTANPYDDKVLGAFLWLANLLTRKKYKPGAAVVTKVEAKRMDAFIRRDATARNRAINAGVIDAEPMDWPDD